MWGCGLGISTLATQVRRGFSPGQLAGLVAWYDPSDLASLFQDVAMTMPVTSAGQSVAVMCDKSGNARHMLQLVTAARPVYATDGTSHWLQFDGVDDSFGASAFGWGSDEASVIFGITRTSDSAIGCLFETSTNSGSSGGTLALFAPNATLNAGVYDFRSKGTAQVFCTPSGFPAPHSALLTATSKIGSDIARLRVNGALVSQNAGDQGTGVFGTHPMFIGRRTNSNFPFMGRFYGAILARRVLSDAELGSSEGWMAGRMGGAA